METIGQHIVEMQALINKAMAPPPDWLPAWQTEAEHILHLAHVARDKGDHDQLRIVDAEAKRMVEKRSAWPSVN